jgi:hypothetical protein
VVHLRCTHHWGIDVYEPVGRYLDFELLPETFEHSVSAGDRETHSRPSRPAVPS